MNTPDLATGDSLRRQGKGFAVLWSAVLSSAWGVAWACGLSALTPWAFAQNAPNSTLPLKNLRVELRQTQDSSASGQRLSVDGSVVLSPGQSAAQVRIQGTERDSQSNRGLSQQITVLNGRSAQAMVGTSVPLRLWQTAPSPQGFRLVPSTVLVERQSGLWVQPRWDGGADLELDVRAALAGGGNPFRPNGASASTETTLRLPLGAWVVLAESENASSQSDQGLVGQGQQQTQSSLRVEVRVTVP
jgi:hypothetical protein